MVSDSITTAQRLSLCGVEVIDTFAEAFPIKGTRLIVTAVNERWARIAAAEFCGNATSVIACDLEAAAERMLSPDETPDGRPGVSILAFGFSRDGLAKAVQTRVGQCILTCATTACFDGLPDCPEDKQVPLGNAIRYFGDGLQISKRLGNRRYWRIPVMDGEFLCEDKLGTTNAIAGGNLILCSRSQEQALAAAEAAVTAMEQIRDVVMPFPGGIVRSGSKVGSKYPKLKASTNDAFCPTVMSFRETELPLGCGAAYEIVIDGLTEAAIRSAMAAGMRAAATCDGLLRISAGNYGGRLGKHHFHLRDLL
ncbi:formylmethanofuran--tetrahydromethanopterin N-formyltransferase [Planctomicrobium piriforme]|uniref:Formylmethanofuran--tetrahydromethanopterin formyltransferase n=1 Tax=Planctomicrobium piriforme TaxID=1576369 RepID=A0A1I3EJ11_9PLAN|nr:formylmethanofuran--tetrahydromethanopterin N-formyltransferase [Planctomicrobium piriforme]SFH98959.1 formylmethanofuran--tetrahydromethanopterin N-formyltransferase [Planctomicrobium piriforme]